MVELLVIVGALTAGAFAFGARTRQRSAAARSLDNYARSRGLRFVPPPPSQPSASPCVQGSCDGVDYVVDLHRLSGEVRTRVVAPARGHAVPLSVLQRDAFLWKGTAALATGDAALDEAYIVSTGCAGDADLLRALRRPLLRMAERRGVWLSADGTRVALTWLGIETHPLVIDAARDAVAILASSPRSPDPYR